MESREPDLPVYVCGVGEDGQGGRDVDGDDDPGSGEDLVVGGGGGGQSGDGHRPVPGILNSLAPHLSTKRKYMTCPQQWPSD